MECVLRSKIPIPLVPREPLMLLFLFLTLFLTPCISQVEIHIPKPTEYARIMAARRLLVAKKAPSKSVYMGCYMRSKADIDPLLEFKSNLWDFFGLLSSWSVENSCNLCALFNSWNGISCDGSNRVISVSLQDHRLATLPNVTNSLPSSLARVSRLSTLELRCEPFAVGSLCLRGTIPADLNKLVDLSNLDLSNNFFSGPIPNLLDTSIGTMILRANWLSGTLDWVGGSQLTTIDVSQNFLSGSLPSKISESFAQGCQNLFLSENLFSGSIPRSWKKITGMVALDVSNNNLSGPLPAWLPNNLNLQQLAFANNSFGGPIPKTWETFTFVIGQNYEAIGFNLMNNTLTGRALEIFGNMCTNMGNNQVPLQFYLSHNRFEGPIPDSFVNCYFLDTLDISYNAFSGPVPDNFFAMRNFGSVQVFLLSNNQLNGTLTPFNISLGPNVQLLDLSYNQFSGLMPNFSCTPNTGPGGNGKVTPISVLLQANNFTGNFPDGLMACNGQMTRLDLSSNSLTGELALLSSLTNSNKDNLLQLNLSHNGFQGPLFLPNSSHSEYIFSIDFSHNNLSGAFPPRVPRKLHLNYLDLSYNSLSSPPADSLLSNIPEVFFLNLSHNAMAGLLPSQWQGMKALRNLSFAFNNLYGPIPSDLASLSALEFLDLSHNALTGTLDPRFANLTKLKQFLVGANSLSGDLPIQLAGVPAPYPNLQVMNFSRNSFSGSIPFGFAQYPTSVILDFSFNNFSRDMPEGNLTFQPDVLFFGNPHLCTNFTNPKLEHGYAYCPKPKSNSIPTWVIILIPIIALLFIGVVLWVAIVYRRTNDEWANGTFKVFARLETKLYISHIVEATERFNDKFLLGRGGFGSVYRATLSGGLTVAIKRLHSVSSQGDREVQAEMETLGNIHHKNLVPLIAAYLAHPPSMERLLVYVFMPNGTLEDVIEKARKDPESPYHTWEFRKKMALDIATGLKYLHHNCVPRIIHRDMKPANVLLDEDMNARIADFGLAREIKDEQSHKSTAAFGTVGYIAPEMVRLGRVSVKSDVYAFGVMLLQFVTGLLPSDPVLGEKTLARWVRSLTPEKYVDDTIENCSKLMDELACMATLGLMCLARVPAERPSMADVVSILENYSKFVEKMAPTARSQGSPKGSGRDSGPTITTSTGGTTQLLFDPNLTAEFLRG